MTKKIFIGIAVVALLFLFILLLFPNKQLSSLPQKPLTSPAATTLKLFPNPVVVTGDSGSIQVILDTNTNHVNFVQIKLKYDPRQLSDVKITQGPFMKNANILATFINTQTGSITYILSIPQNQKPIKGTGTIATITFKTSLKPQQSTPIAFSQETLVTDDIHTESILKKTVGTKIQREN